MKKRNCRKTEIEREQHDRAIRVRKMTDAQLCEYLDNLENGRAENRKRIPKPEETITAFLQSITSKEEDGMKVSDITAKKLTKIAQARGFLPADGIET